MVRGQRKPVQKKEYLSPSETQVLQEERQELQANLAEIQSGAGVGTVGSQIDAGKIQREIKTIDRALEERAVASIRGSQKDNLYKEESKIEEQLQVGMPTRDEMRYPSRNPGAVRKHMEWCRVNKSAIERYVEIQRMLRPNDPKSVEALRKDK